MKLMLKAPGTMRLKLKYDELLPSFSFDFNSRHYIGGDFDCPVISSDAVGGSWVRCNATAGRETKRQGLTLVHFADQLKTFLVTETLKSPIVSHKRCLR